MHETTTNGRHEVLALASLLLLSCSLSSNARASESELGDAEIEASCILSKELVSSGVFSPKLRRIPWNHCLSRAGRRPRG